MFHSTPISNYVIAPPSLILFLIPFPNVLFIYLYPENAQILHILKWEFSEIPLNNNNNETDYISSGTPNVLPELKEDMHSNDNNTIYSGVRCKVHSKYNQNFKAGNF
jgi:hypothetical protein